MNDQPRNTQKTRKQETIVFLGNAPVLATNMIREAASPSTFSCISWLIPLQLEQKTNAAFQQAATKVIERAKQTGAPVVVREEGKVKEVTPDEAIAKPKTESEEV